MQDLALRCPSSALKRRRLLGGVVLALAIVAAPVRAEVWGYVDDNGQPHLSDHQLDTRYRLFFRGEASAESAAATQAPADAIVTSDTLPGLANPAALRRYEQLIEQHAAQASVDPALVKAIVAVESGFAPHAVSPKGALGLMQVMPQTAARYGVTSDRRKSAEQKLLDPALNVEIGTRYLRDLLARFADNIALTLAAYNAGENAVERYRNRVPPYPETVEYVRRVQELYAAFRPAPAKTIATAEPTPTLLGRKRIRGTFFALPNVAQTATEPVL